eukprot:scaffold7592_cov43-Attheya_sp.AAC.3
MLGPLVGRLGRPMTGMVPRGAAVVASPSWRTFSTEEEESGGAGGVAREDMPFFHHRRPPRPLDAPPRIKFKSPVKRASKLYHELKLEAVQRRRSAFQGIGKGPGRRLGPRQPRPRNGRLPPRRGLW